VASAKLKSVETLTSQIDELARFETHCKRRQSRTEGSLVTKLLYDVKTILDQSFDTPQGACGISDKLEKNPELNLGMQQSSCIKTKPPMFLCKPLIS
jgi:hypothetical protein